MDYKNLSAGPGFTSPSKTQLAPIYTRNQKATMVMDVQTGAESASSSTAASSALLSPTAGLRSPTKRSVLARTPIRSSPKKGAAVDANMQDSSGGLTMGMIEPLNLVAMEQLGEPDPTAISKHDLLSAMAFDRTG